MKTALLLVAIAACSSKSSPGAPSGSASPSPAPATPITTLTDAHVNSLGQAVVAALGKPDSKDLFALALTTKDVRPMFETMKKTCPDKGKDIDYDALTKTFEEQLGTDAERETTARTIHADCAKVGDFSKATFTKATPKEPKVDCGIGSVDNVIVEASIDGKPVFLHVDDPVHTAAGWRFPENIRCSADISTL